LRQPRLSFGAKTLLLEAMAPLPRRHTRRSFLKATTVVGTAAFLAISLKGNVQKASGAEVCNCYANCYHNCHGDCGRKFW
jgi:hypothetical protein